MKKELINETEELSVSKQCKLLSFPRSSFYYKPKGCSDEDFQIMKLIDMLYTQNPTFGTRRLSQTITKSFGISVGRDRIRSLMRVMGISAIYPKKNLSLGNKEHTKYPYLLRKLTIDRVNHVWSTDITYIPLSKGFGYLTAVIDWYSRKVLAWKISNTMDVSLCTEVLQEALEKYGKPEIFNTDQGSQYTSNEFTGILKENGIKISMDGKGRALDNIFVERLWRTVKQEEVYLNDYQNLGEARVALNRFFIYYNTERRHSALEYEVPDDIFSGKIILGQVG